MHEWKRGSWHTLDEFHRSSGGSRYKDIEADGNDFIMDIIIYIKV